MVQSSKSYTSNTTKRVATRPSHCTITTKELVGNQKWIQRNFKTTTKMSQISISIGADDEEDENSSKRLDGIKITKGR